MRNARNGPTHAQQQRDGSITDAGSGWTNGGVSRRRNGEWWRIRRGMRQVVTRPCCCRRQQRQVGKRPCETTSSAHIVGHGVATNDAKGAICTRCARTVCRCTGAINAPRRELAPHRVSKGLGPTAAEHCPGRKSDVARPAVDCFSAPHQSWRRNYEADHTAVDCFALARFMLETKRRDGSICGRPLFVAPSTAAGCHRSATVGEAKVPPTISYSG